MQMNDHKREADTATETAEEKKKGKLDRGEKLEGGGYWRRGRGGEEVSVPVPERMDEVEK